MKIMCVLMAAVFIISLTSCGPAPREGIVGTWAAANQTVEIGGDGTIVFTDRLKEQPSTGSYTFVDDTHVKVTFADSSTEEFKVSVSSSQLKVMRSDGSVFAKYNRVK
jgi:hypothetical protein